ncbi:MAG TPA: hypothetical protein VGW34_05120, partial [Allosphingosinicella sp.]|nr:hypothetical protein [Allosphingosinicella sp.]
MSHVFQKGQVMRLSTLVSSAALLLSGLAPTPLPAQPASGASADAEAICRPYLENWREGGIMRGNLTAASPVTVVNSREVKSQGTTRTEDLIETLPQSFANPPPPPPPPP